jgi:hypothetical protein
MSAIDNEVKALRFFTEFLMREIKKVTARGEAYRCLLISKGVFSNDEFEEMYAKSLAEWDRAMTDAVVVGQKVAIDEGFQKLLERHQGTKQ